MAVPPPGSFEGQCPSCGKHFANDSFVLRHMNHPRTSCQNWFQFLASMRLEQSTSTSDDNSDRETANDCESADDRETASDHETANDHEETLATATQVVHPNTPSIFGLGAGFMDQFRADPLAGKRSENVYHLFSSKEEWGLASWLSCSGLSMRAIDDLLALPIVRVHLCVTYSLSHQASRFSTFHSPLQPRKHYAPTWTNSPKPPNGTCKTSRSTDIKPQSQSCCFTAIHSKLSRPSSRTPSLKDAGILTPEESTTALIIKIASSMSG